MSEGIETWISSHPIDVKEAYAKATNIHREGAASSATSSSSCSAFIREWRHNSCLMTPMCAALLMAVIVTSLVTLICSIPQFVLGLVLGPLIQRSNWLVEFLYPIGFVGRAHLWLVQFVQRRQGGGLTSPAPHSMAMEQRFQVLPGKVYVHSIPLLLDNLAYLIVFCSPKDNNSLIGYIIDCGHAEEIRRAIDRVRFFHYKGRPIIIQAILSTHKHHDHTGGNQQLLQKCYPDTIRHIYGGSVERVPMCTDKVKNGDRIPVPKELQDCCEIEVMAAPSHTRGSVIYILRGFAGGTKHTTTTKIHGDTTVQLFTGDVMFSAGGGLPFEADFLSPKNKDTALKPSAGMNSIERCFAELLVRLGDGVPLNQVAIFPGHEYTMELLRRQFDTKADYGKFWHRLAPSVFFETASQYFVAHHKRNLPRGTKLITTPSPLERELLINPHFRSLIHRAEMFLHALQSWKQFYEEDMAKLYPPSSNQRSELMSVVVGNTTSIDSENQTTKLDTTSQKGSLSSNDAIKKTNNTKASWTLTNEALTRKVFCTVYAAELDDIIEELKKEKITGSLAACKLMEMRRKLDEHVVSRKPVPNTTPSDSNKKLIALAMPLLGSPPTALAPSDAVRMNLPRPVSNPDKILISKKRLVSVLYRLGILSNLTDSDEIQAINFLWQVSQNRDLQLVEEIQESTPASVSQTTYSSVVASAKIPAGNVLELLDDEVELGVLKATLFGPSKPPCWAGMCYPCSKTSANKQHPTLTKVRRQSAAELVRHELETCYICKDYTGCFHLQERTSGNEISKSEVEAEFLLEDDAVDSSVFHASWQEL